MEKQQQLTAHSHVGKDFEDIMVFWKKKGKSHIWDCNFFVWKYFYLKIVSTERYGRVDDVYAVACPKTPPGHKDTVPRSQEKIFSRARSQKS